MPRIPRPHPEPPDRGRGPTSRREFLSALGAASALPLLTVLPAAGQTPPDSLPAVPALPAAAGNSDEALDAEARSLAEILQHRYGARWTEAQLYALRGDIRGGLDDGRVLRKAALSNGDEPATIFVVLPSEA